jgi:hypothetical protein
MLSSPAPPPAGQRDGAGAPDGVARPLRKTPAALAAEDGRRRCASAVAVPRAEPTFSRGVDTVTVSSSGGSDKGGIRWTHLRPVNLDSRFGCTGRGRHQASGMPRIRVVESVIGSQLRVGWRQAAPRFPGRPLVESRASRKPGAEPDRARPRCAASWSRARVRGETRLTPRAQHTSSSTAASDVADDCGPWHEGRRGLGEVASDG